jgi:peptidyl-prolyl cis-trans isomerase D
MAAIGKIREKSGLLIVIIGVALAAFVLGDLFKNLGKGKVLDQSKIALINDEKISSMDFNRRVNEQAELTKEQLKKNDLTAEETYNNAITVWNTIKRETILRQQMLELGLVQYVGNSHIAEVSMDEYMDNINGNNPHREILRNFSDPKTGQFDPKAVANFLNYVEQGVQSEDPKQREQAIKSKEQWKLLSTFIKNDILNTKYNNLISKAYYLPKALAEVDFEDNNRMERIALFGARYNLIKDEEVTPTDADFQAYYDEHKNEFENKQENRRIDYIVWDVRPSAKDVQDLQAQIYEYKNELATIEKENLPYFINRIGDNRFDSSWVKAGTLSPYIDSSAFASEIGTVLGPWKENSAFHIAKVIGHSLRPDSMKASHILISYAGAYGAPEVITRTKIGARALADSIKDVILKKSDSFEELANLSDDPSAKDNKGELGWFADGTMVPEFNQACLDGKKGDITIVETSFGYHVIRIDDKKEATDKIQIAQIDLPIVFSQETFSKVYGEAIKFAALNQTYESFDTSSANQGLAVRKSNFVNNLSSGINGLKNSRDVVKWMFKDGVTKGSVSPVFDFENQVMVAAVTEINPKGILPLENIKESITVLVMRDLKAKMLIEKLNGKDLDIAQKMSSNVDTITLSFASYSIPNYGPEQNVQGRMFNCEVNKTMGPIKGDQGVYMFKVLDKGSVPETKNLKQYQDRSYSTFNQKVNTSAYQALEENANIDEFLYFFY